MKKVICIFLVLLFLLNSASCAASKKTFNEPIQFFYCRTEYQYHGEESIIVAEEREISGHSGDWSYIFALYFMGPLSDDLTSPFPPDTRFLRYTLNNDSIQLSISDMDEKLSDSKFTLAAVCIAMTFLNATDHDQVTITSGQRSIVIDRDKLVLKDLVVAN